MLYLVCESIIWIVVLHVNHLSWETQSLHILWKLCGKTLKKHKYNMYKSKEARAWQFYVLFHSICLEQIYIYLCCSSLWAIKDFNPWNINISIFLWTLVVFCSLLDLWTRIICIDYLNRKQEVKQGCVVLKFRLLPLKERTKLTFLRPRKKNKPKSRAAAE